MTHYNPKKTLTKTHKTRERKTTPVSVMDELPTLDLPENPKKSTPTILTSTRPSAFSAYPSLFKPNKMKAPSSLMSFMQDHLKLNHNA